MTPSPQGGQERAFWVLLSMVPGIGPVRFRRLLEVCGDAHSAWQASGRELATAGLERRSIDALRGLRARLQVEEALADLERWGIRPHTLLDAEYPAALRHIADPPPVLFERGHLTPADERSVALVGTRRATAYGRAAAERLARDLVRAGVTVVSGLAKGIDTAAHRAAVEAGGRTVAVLANGLDQVYPAENARLAGQIVDGGLGALVSELAPGVPPDAANFPRRNRIISGLSAATVIVEAGVHSGALITADFALEQGREVLAVPGSIFNPYSAGTNALIRQGATPVTCVDDVLEALRLPEGSGTPWPAGEPEDGLERSPPALPLDDREEVVLAATGLEARHVDELARELGACVGDVSAALTMLELKGLVRQIGPQAYVRSGPR